MTADPKVLILDDEPEIALELSDYLTINGFPNLYSIDPYDALQFIKRYASIKLILLDRRMPIMDGYEFIKRAKKLIDHGRSIKFVIITGHLTDVDFNQAALNGADSVLPKPIDLGRLKNIVEKTISSP